MKEGEQQPLTQEMPVLLELGSLEECHHKRWAALLVGAATMLTFFAFACVFSLGHDSKVAYFLFRGDSGGKRIDDLWPPGEELPNTTMQIIKVNGQSFHQIGIGHGRQARKRIQGFLQTRFMKGLKEYRDGDGSQFFQKMVTINTATFPDYADEIDGIANGAHVPVADIWLANLMGEVMSASDYNVRGSATTGTFANVQRRLAPLNSTGIFESSGRRLKEEDSHCSSFVLQAPRGEVALAHNEDWSSSFVEFLYLLDASYPDVHLWGFPYPGQILGFAIVANEHGLYTTQNSVSPDQITPGLGLTFVTRSALAKTTIKEVADELAVGTLAWGISMNVISFKEHAAANIEVVPNQADILYSTRKTPLVYHFNHFSHLRNVNGYVPESSLGRTLNFQGGYFSESQPKDRDELTKFLCFRGRHHCNTYDCIFRSSTMLSVSAGIKEEPRPFFFSAKRGTPHALWWLASSPCSSAPDVEWTPEQGFQRYARHQASPRFMH